MTEPAVKENDNTLKLTFSDPQRVIGRHRGATLHLLGAFVVQLLKSAIPLHPHAARSQHVA